MVAMIAFRAMRQLLPSMARMIMKLPIAGLLWFLRMRVGWTSNGTATIELALDVASWSENSRELRPVAVRGMQAIAMLSCWRSMRRNADGRRVTRMALLLLHNVQNQSSERLWVGG